MKRNISDPPATEKSAASKKNEEAPVAADTSSIQRSPEIVETSEISTDKTDPSSKSGEGKLALPMPVPHVKMAKTLDLKPHPRNEKFYGPSEIDESLKTSIGSLGIQQPLVVHSDGTVLQGHRRLFTAKELGMTEIPVIFVDIPDPVDQLESLLSGNAQRTKTNEERAREYLGHLEIESARAKKRQATNIGSKGAEAGKPETAAKTGQKRSKKAQHGQNSSEADAESGKARDIAAAKVSWSGPTAQNAARVVDVIDTIQKKEAASPILQEIRKKFATSVNAAVQECTRQNLFDDTAKPPTKNKAGEVQTESFSRSGRSFAAQQFNPFTNDCKLNAKAMSWLNVKEPSKSGDDAVRASILALPSSLDLLQAKYADEDVNAFADKLEQSSQWICLVETSEFDRVTKFKWPKNAWIGFTVATQKEANKAEEVVQSVNAKTRWLHCRLDSESLVFQKLEGFDWIVISVTNENMHWEDVEPILVRARKAKCRVFFDPSVKCRPQEFPKADKTK